MRWTDASRHTRANHGLHLGHAQDYRVEKHSNLLCHYNLYSPHFMKRIHKLVHEWSREQQYFFTDQNSQPYNIYGQPWGVTNKIAPIYTHLDGRHWNFNFILGCPVGFFHVWAKGGMNEQLRAFWHTANHFTSKFEDHFEFYATHFEILSGYSVKLRGNLRYVFDDKNMLETWQRYFEIALVMPYILNFEHGSHLFMHHYRLFTRVQDCRTKRERILLQEKAKELYNASFVCGLCE